MGLLQNFCMQLFLSSIVKLQMTLVEGLGVVWEIGLIQGDQRSGLQVNW